MTRRPTRGLPYILPALLVYVTFVLLPAAHTVYLSFFEWDGINPATYLGLDNYRATLTEPLLRGSLLHAFVLILFFSFLPILVALLVVCAVGPKPIRGLAVIRTIIFLPQVLPLVAVGIMWRWMYLPDGLVNEVLRSVGADGLARTWLGDPRLALPAVGLVGSWVLTGLCLTFFLTGVQRIDPELYDAAAVDGAGRVREFAAVTLPGLRREIAVALTITMVAALASFDIIYVTTNGSPADTTTVPGLLVYRLAFDQGRIGAGAALAVVLTCVVVAVVLLANALVRERS